MNGHKLLGLSTGSIVLVAALFAIGSVFIGANGLITASIFAAAASLCAGTMGVAELGRAENSTNLITAVGVSALTFSLLFPLFTWTANATIPFAAVSVMALVPALFWAATWIISQTRSSQSTAGAI